MKPVYNPMSPTYSADLYRFYRELHAQEPVHYSPVSRGWYVTGYRDTQTVLNDSRFSANRVDSMFSTLPPQVQEAIKPLRDELKAWALMMDPPRHGRVRTVLQKAFSPALARAMAPKIEEMTAQVYDSLPKSGTFDFVKNVAYPMPVSVIGVILGVPVENFEWLRRCSQDVANALAMSGKPDPAVAAAALRSLAEIRETMKRIVAERRQKPELDLISALVATDADSDPLTDHEILASCSMVLFAGHETTTHLLGNAIYLLLTHQEELAKLRANPSLIDSAVEEVLRFESPVQLPARLTLEDVVLSGVTILKGERVATFLGAAHRDPSVFENPDVFSIERRDNKHLAFGLGRHFCVGAMLARLEGRIILGEFFRRFPNARLESPHANWLPNPVFRGLADLHVVVG